jgi:hypothetical protein
MKYNKACNILNLIHPFSNKELKQNYYIKALEYHPDKNQQVNATEKFQEISEAYNYLNEYKDYLDFTDISSNSPSREKYSYFNILENFIGGITDKNIDVAQFISILNSKYSEISIQILKQLPKNTLLTLHKFIDQYSDILHINSDIIDAINKLVTDSIKNDTIIIIKPTVENLLNDDVYIVSFKDEKYYIPYWHHELVYDLSDTALIIRCEPTIPDYMDLDQYNNLSINISMQIHSIMNKDSITLNILDRKYIIPVNELYIKKHQRYALTDGISRIDMRDIYNINNRANIYINITFTDL